MKRLFQLSIWAILLGLSACQEDVFDKQPLDRISDADVWNEPSLIRSYVTSLYARFPFNSPFGDTYRYSDEASIADGPRTNITQGTVSRTSEGLAYWDYVIIRDCNVFLEKVSTLSLTEAEKKTLEAEVRVVRSVAYFEKAKRYGGVPLVTQTLDPFASIQQNMLPRNKEVEVYDFVLKELGEAANSLPTNAAPQGKINRWVALAYQARVALWAASIAKYGTEELNGLVGVPAARANAYYQQAQSAADAVVKSGKYSLYNKNADKARNYQNIFTEKSHSEVIFHRVFNGVDIGHNFDKANIPPSFTGPGAGKCNPVWEMLLSYENTDGSNNQPQIGNANLYRSMAEVFVKSDPRLHATIMFQGQPWQGDSVQVYEGIDLSVTPNPDPTKLLADRLGSYRGKPQTGKDGRYASSNDNVTKTGFYIKKYMNEANVQPIQGRSTTNWIEIRLAEMYLIQAEAAFELGSTAEAVTAINFTRTRAGILPLSATNISRERIRNERKVELAFEGHRYWDLRRWRTAVTALTNSGKRFQGVRVIFHWASQRVYFVQTDGEDFVRAFRREHYYNPITNARINNMPSLVENPNY